MSGSAGGGTEEMLIRWTRVAVCAVVLVTACGEGDKGREAAVGGTTSTAAPSAEPKSTSDVAFGCPAAEDVQTIIEVPFVEEGTNLLSSGELGECYFSFDSAGTEPYDVIVSFLYEPYRTGDPGRGSPADDLGAGVVRNGPVEEATWTYCEIFEAQYTFVSVGDFRGPNERGPVCAWAEELRNLDLTD
jgi:hypothetical protein